MQMTLIQRRLKVDATSWRCIDFEPALHKRHVRAGKFLTEHISDINIQSTRVISNSKGLSEIIRGICTSTYQICSIEEKLIGLTTFNKYVCNWTLEVRDILYWKYCGKEEKLLHRSNISSFPQYFYILLDFHI